MANYQYWSDKKHGKLLEQGWKLYQFTATSKRLWRWLFRKHSTSSEHHAIKAFQELINNQSTALIICGYDKNNQRVKMYSVIFKEK